MYLCIYVSKCVCFYTLCVYWFATLPIWWIKLNRLYKFVLSIFTQPYFVSTLPVEIKIANLHFCAYFPKIPF